MHSQKLWRGLVLGSLVALIVAVFASARSGPLPAAQRFERLSLQGGEADREQGPLMNIAALREPIVSVPDAFGTIKSLKDVPAVPFKPSAALSRAEEPELPRRSPSGVSGPDAVAQTWAGTVAMPSPIANFDGISLADQGISLSPPDTNGDIGYDPATGKRYYFQWINLAYKAWDVTNPATPTVVVPLAAGNALWQAALPGTQCAIENSGDPIVLFDEQAHRWFISQFSIGGGVGNYSPFHQCVAVSQTADPAGAWYVYDYAYRDAVTYFNDYPHFGVWPDATYNAYYMTVHEFNTAGTAYLGQSAAAFNRAKLLAGDDSAELVVFALGTNYGGMLPADLDGTPPASGTPGFFFMTDPAGTLQIWEFKPDWVTPANSVFGVGAGHTADYALTIATYTDACETCVPQSSAVQKLDSLGDRLMHRVAFRALNGGIQTAVLNHTVDADGSGSSTRTGLRWYEARRNSVTGAWTLNQQMTYAPGSTEYRWMGSIATDQSGNIALGYSASSPTLFPAIRYTGRLFTDTVSTLPQTEVTLTVSAGAQTGSVRWGDYSMLGVDPQDGCTFWYTQEYNGATASLPWKTRIGSFKFAECTPVSTGNLSGTVRNAANSNPIASATVTAISSSGGTYPTATDGSGRYQIVSLPIGTYTVTASAAGYNPAQATGVTVATGITTTQDLALTALPQADVSLIKTASASILAPGSALAYTLTVTNNGPDVITTTVTVTDVLPSDYVLGTATGAGWSCSGTTTVVCTRTGLGVGASASISLTGTAPATIGSIVNTATVNSNVADLSLANNTSAVNGMITPSTDLALTKTGPAFAAPGATLVYTLNVTNNGPLATGQATQTVTNAAPITIVDNNAAALYPSPIIIAGGGAVQKATANILGITHTYPSDVDMILVSPTGTKSWLMSDVIGGTNVSNLNLTFDDAAASAIGCPTVATPVSGTYKPTDCSDTNTDVFPAPAPTGPYTASLALFNNTDPTGTWNLYVRDDASIDTGSVGGWSLTLITGYAGPITVTDTLPAGTTYVGAGGNGWSCSQAGGVVTCTRATLAPGAAPAIVITATAPLSTGVITNTALVTSGLSESVPANNATQFATSITTGGPTYDVTMTPSTAGQSSLAGTTVTYTLNVTNTGNASDTFTVTLSGNAYTSTAPATVGPLAAGANTTLNIVVTIPAGAAGGANDTVNVTMTSQGDPTKFASAALTTTVMTILRGVSVSPAAAQSALPGAIVTYTLSVTNTGNASDTFTVTVSGNAFVTNAPASIGPLAAGANSTMDVLVTIPAAAAGGASDAADVTVTSHGDPTKFDNSTLTTTAATVRGVAITPGAAGQSGDPGAVVIYTLNVTNTGNASDTYTVTLTGNAFVTSAPASIGPLAAGASSSLNVTVTVPAGAASGASDAANVTVTSRGDPVKFASSTLTTTVNTVRGVTMTPGAIGQAGLPGAEVTYTLNVTNTGNTADTFAVMITGNAFGATAPVTVGPLAAGASTPFEVTVTIPTGTPAGTTDTATVTLKSQGDNTITANANLTTAVWFGVYLPTVLK
ncbi:MAG: DUF11 domain-containing protein [Chloroflexi bacterium]|nr:DUF11 domain-containing protein [Chloroflexota bacterium]